MPGAQSLMESTLVPEPRVGRVYRAQRTIRLADVAADGRLRLDAMARYMQDVASDDVTDAGAEDELLTWVVRRTLIDVEQQFGTDRSASLATWASGAGSHWAARRTSITGDAGGHAEAESIWVILDRATSRPARLPALFDELYGTSGLGRKVSAKLELPAAPAPETVGVRWPIRVSDIDTLGHANNAVYWAAVEDAVAALGWLPAVAEIEYHRPALPGSEPRLLISAAPAEAWAWLLNGGRPLASARMSAR